MKHRIHKFYSTPKPNVRLTSLHSIFLAENTEVHISYAHFCRLSRELTAVRTIKTGGVEVDLRKLASVIAGRAFHGINFTNTIAIDEKPVVIKNYLTRSIRVLKNHKGPMYKSMMYGIKMPPFYIIAAVDKNGLISFKVSDKPIHKEDFESFLAHVAIANRNDAKQYLLFDNASFHDVCPECLDILKENNFDVTKTSPSSCFLDPIEEFFGIFDTCFKEKYQKAIVTTGHFNPLTRHEIYELIINCLNEANRNLFHQFLRALL